MIIQVGGLTFDFPATWSVLHLEQPAKASKLFPRVFDLADVQQKLRQLIKPLDPHPLVVDMDRLGSVAWTVRSGAQR